MSLLQISALTTEDCGTITTKEELESLFKRIPKAAKVAVDTEGNPVPFCVFLAFLEGSSKLVYASIALGSLTSPSVLDLKFQAGVGWAFRPAVDEEVGIDYELLDCDGQGEKVEFKAGMALEKANKTIITIARVATAEQIRSIALGEDVAFLSGKATIIVKHNKSTPLYAALVSAEHVAVTKGIHHLVGDAKPEYQNLTMEAVLTKQMVPENIDPSKVQEGQFFILELADETGKKEEFVVVYPGCTLQKATGKPLVRILPKRGGGSTIDLPGSTLDVSTVSDLLQSLVVEKKVTFTAHQKDKEEKDLKIVVTNDSFEIMQRLSPVLKAAGMKAGGSFAVFHLLQAVLKTRGGAILVCGNIDLQSCADCHSLPVEVCVLALLYPILEQLSDEDIREDLRASIEIDDQLKKDALEAALKMLTLFDLMRSC